MACKGGCWADLRGQKGRGWWQVQAKATMQILGQDRGARPGGSSAAILGRIEREVGSWWRGEGAGGEGVPGRVGVAGPLEKPTVK